MDRNARLRRSASIWLDVALRKESVDRNVKIMSVSNGLKRSLSARRAWIEISDVVSVQHGCEVALRKESVDRNHDGMLKYRDAERRSPQGERG